jgi:putative DNA primase/helicase
MTIRLAPTPLELPDIQIGVDLERMTDAAIGALAHDDRVFQRGGQLVGVVTIPDGPGKPSPRGITRAKGAPVIRPLAAPTVRERMAASARWVKYDGRRKDYVQSLPPEPVVSAVCARGEWGGVRPLVSVATSPSLKPDGTVLQTPGYDADTAILLWPREAYASVGEAPTLDDARGALDALREVVCDFPFARPEHESAWIAGVLTMLARPAIDGPCPLFCVDATTRGTGKSRLVDAAVRLAHGQDAARTSLPEDDDEMRKRISALMLEGDPAVCLDNVVRTIALPSLDAVLTATVWKDRMLGSTATLNAPARAVWWTTGNNIALGGDLSRRTLHVRLESPLENPEERTGFKHPDLLRWVDSERKRLVGAALTLLRAYTLAGMPYQGGLWGSFESWSRLIPGALVWAGTSDPLLARASAEPSMDDDKRSLSLLIDGLRKLCPIVRADQPARAMSAKSILDALYPDRDPRDGPQEPDGYDQLRDAIEQETRCPTGRKPEARRLGKWLQRVRGRVVDGWLIQRHEGADHSACWRSEPIKI